jgi:hypothetical protein
MGMLYFLSNGVEVTKEEEKNGLVTVTKQANSGEANWDDVLKGFFRVYYSDGSKRPKNAFMAVWYRNKWFYIADNDLESKTTFMLLSQIFNLQSSRLKLNEPILTLPLASN